MSYRDPHDPAPGTRAYTQGHQQAPQQYPTGQYTGQYYAEETGQWDQQTRRQPIVPAPAVNPVLFVGGVLMTGVVVALAVGLVAWIITTATKNVEAVHLDEGAVTTYAIFGFLAAIFAAAFWYVLQLITPAPNSFFSWIGALLLIAAVVSPLLLQTGGNLATSICTAVLALVIGLPILGLIPMVGTQSTKR
ncbi:MAG: hypothetical protein QM728_04835 [Gordonia sp. (in: high G+C Gram-positive bacteria)]|uniref:hypothetical protein n=1 Tax=Gordonia sp. (in: high G+C Gram-positive bacteria) TaxID=84139 RepID=UPI0039E6A847